MADEETITPEVEVESEVTASEPAGDISSSTVSASAPASYFDNLV